MSKDVEKTNESQSLVVVLNKLAELLEKSVTVYEETRAKALENHNYFRGLMEAHHDEDNTISEDGVLEKATNDSMKLVIESAKTLEGPINTLTKVLTTKMVVEANKEAGFVGKPINIDDWKS